MLIPLLKEILYEKACFVNISFFICLLKIPSFIAFLLFLRSVFWNLFHQSFALFSHLHLFCTLTYVYPLSTSKIQYIHILCFFYNPLQPIPLAYISLQVLNKVLNVMRVYKHSIFCASNSSPVLARERCQNTEKMFPAHPVASFMHSIMP